VFLANLLLPYRAVKSLKKFTTLSLGPVVSGQADSGPVSYHPL